MEGIQFEEDNFQNMGHQNYQVKTSKFNMFLIKNGIAKNEMQANIIMLSLAALFLISTVVIYKSFIFKTPPKIVPYEELTEEEKLKIPLEERRFIENQLKK